MIKKNLSGILIVVGTICLAIYIPILESTSIIFSSLYLIIGIGLILIGIGIQRKIKKGVDKKDLLDSLPD